MSNPVIQLPWSGLLLPILLLPACFWLALVAMRRMATSLESLTDGQLPGAESLTVSSPLHTWDPRGKIVGILSFALCTVSLNQPVLVLLALTTALLLIAVGRLPWSRPARRLLAMNGFLAMFLIVMPLTAVIRPDDTLIVFGSLDSWPVNLRGLLLALLILGKAWTVALLMEPLLATAPLSTTLEGLSHLGAPRRVGELLLLTHRYIHVFFAELTRLRNGMEARAFQPGLRVGSLRDYGNFVGMLLVRSFERTHRVYDAMRARGYRGSMPNRLALTFRPADVVKTALLLGLGLALLLADRLPGGLI
ncbi:MAG: cobalt ECF transporter T component CbiQ [Desulfuromonadales bacterium]|nr:cobalt ECF transporter T component CbiQ [Desulfuromonadales bacterium]